MDPSGKLKDKMFLKGYRSLMMQIPEKDLETANEDIRDFIASILKEDKLLNTK
jgi:hypothetical protein